MRPIHLCALAAAASAGLFVSSPARAACSSDTDCSGGPARIMIVVDASSTMLNDGNMAAAEGGSIWDTVRTVVAAPTGDTLYDAPVEPPGPVASQVVHFGVAVFGNDVSEEQRILVDYAPCSRPRVDWSLNPESSCVDPGCMDPWSGPVIEWTYQRGDQIDPPGFASPTYSHMPRCEGNAMACGGSGRFVAPIIELITDHHSAYLDDTPYAHDSTTDFVNILLVADEYEDADAAAVQAALEDAFTAGITTYVVGVGDAAATPAGGFMTQLDDLADWGSGGAENPRLAPNSGQLDTVLQEIIASHSLPCCASIDCSHVGGADGGGGVDGTASDSAGDAADWGGQDGTAGDAGDAGSADGTAGSGNTDTETGGALDDDGGCTCRTRSRPAPAWALVLAGIVFATRRRPRAR